MTNATPNLLRRVKIKRRTFSWILIIVGAVIIILYGIRSFRSFRELQFAQEQGLLDGTASVEAIRPWMTIRYIGVAYAVPEEYIFSELDIPFDRRNHHDTLGRLNFGNELGRSPNGDYPAIIDTTQAIILAYREDPVVTGLEDIRPWMSIQYIANSTGVPASYIFEQLDIPEAENAFKPLDLLDHELRLGGSRRLAAAVEDILGQYEAEE